MARILCVNPWIYDFAAYNMWIEPLGLLTVAGVLRQAGHEVTLLDCLDRYHPAAPAPQSAHDAYGRGHFSKVELRKPPALAHIPRRWGRYGLPVDVVETELQRLPRPDAVLVTSMMTYWYPGPFEAIRRIKAHWPDVPVALGGVYATLCTEHARACSGADVVLPGPGESQVLEWVNAVSGETRRLADDPAEVLPAHDLRRAQGYVTVQTAKGCPFNCPYCAVHQIVPGGFTPRRPEQVVEEIAWCVQGLGLADVVFYDDALLCQASEHLHVVLDRLLERGVRARFHTPNGLHARFLDPELARKMRRAGFVTVRLGLETSDPEQSLRDGGKVEPRAFVQAVEALQTAGFSAQELAAYVLIARPGQSFEQVRATVRFAHSLGVPVSPAEYTPVPNTAEWRVAVAAGNIAEDADPLLHNKSIYPCGRGRAWEALKQEIREANQRLGYTERPWGPAEAKTTVDY